MSDKQIIATSDYHYDLPEELIAQHGSAERDHSRLLYVPPAGPSRDHMFYELPELLRAGDLLVFNNSKVIPARLYGTTPGGEKPVEVLLLRRVDDTVWRCIGRPGRKLRPGRELTFIEDKLTATVREILEGGERLIEFHYDGIWEEVLAEAGEMPLPPYIHEKLDDPDRYNTVYAKIDGSAAAPTAGLHFTPELLQKLKDRGIETAEVTLHVGLGTFRPVKEENILDHEMHSEYYELSPETVATIQKAKAEGRRVIAVGTTTCRVLESVAKETGQLEPRTGETQLYIYPPYDFKVIDGLLTNFHLPESTLLLLVSAFMGRERVLQTYHEAIERRYRFFSFGDACLFMRRD